MSGTLKDPRSQSIINTAPENIINTGWGVLNAAEENVLLKVFST